MAKRIEFVGNGFVKIDGTLTNLASVKTVGKRELGYDEDPDGNTCAILITPMNVTEKDKDNGSDGSYHILYKEEKDRDVDYATVEKALKDNRK